MIGPKVSHDPGFKMGRDRVLNPPESGFSHKLPGNDNAGAIAGAQLRRLAGPLPLSHSGKRRQRHTTTVHSRCLFLTSDNSTLSEVRPNDSGNTGLSI